MTAVIDAVRSEYLRYKKLAEDSFSQTGDDDLSRQGPADNNSIAVIAWHISGNLKSRFSDFLVSDGEKPWRQRDEEFEARTVTRQELLAKWDEGWVVLLNALSSLTDADLIRTVTIRGQALSVIEALQRSVTHVSYHVGQIVYLAKSYRGEEWKSLSIPKGQSQQYNKAPNLERPRT